MIYWWLKFLTSLNVDWAYSYGGKRCWFHFECSIMTIVRAWGDLMNLFTSQFMLMNLEILPLDGNPTLLGWASNVPNARHVLIGEVSIWYLNIRHRRCLMASIIFGYHDRYNVWKKAKLFIIWCVLDEKYVNTGAFIIHHLVEVVKTTCKSIIGVGGTLIVIS